MSINRVCTKELLYLAKHKYGLLRQAIIHIDNHLLLTVLHGLCIQMGSQNLHLLSRELYTA